MRKMLKQPQQQQQLVRKVHNWMLVGLILLLQVHLSQSFSVRTGLVHTSTHPPTTTTQVISSSLNNNNNSNNQKKSRSLLFNAVENSDDNNLQTPLPTYGGLIGKLTGLSMTAIRKSVRTTTGLSITASRTALRGLTGVSVTASMKMLSGIFPPWFRYFLQPFFIMYYTPLMIAKYFIGSTKTAKKEATAAHEKIVEGWKDAIRAAELAQESWPLHVTDDGQIQSLTPQSVPITDVIVESLDIASTVQSQPKE